MTRVRKSTLWILAGVVIGALALTFLSGPALAQTPQAEMNRVLSEISMGSAHFALDWNVVGTGGGTISSAHFNVSSTIGQPAVGTADSAHFDLCTGYWCWLDRIAEIFLPLVIKG